MSTTPQHPGGCWCYQCHRAREAAKVKAGERVASAEPDSTEHCFHAEAFLDAVSSMEDAGAEPLYIECDIETFEAIRDMPCDKVPPCNDDHLELDGQTFGGRGPFIDLVGESKLLDVLIDEKRQREDMGS